MVRVLVYHGDTERLELLCRIIRAYFQQVRCPYHLTGYRNPDAVREHLKNPGQKDDILLLDCSRLTETADLIRQLRRSDQQASWVYMDGDLTGLVQSLILRPSAYLPGSSQAKEIIPVLQRLVQYHQAMQKKYHFTFKCEGEYIRIPYAEISYFESSAKKVTLHLDKQARTYDFSAKLDDIEAQLPDQFLRCHQSYLVNMQMIRRLATREHVFLLRDHEEILISRRNYTYAKERYQQFSAEHQS